MFNAPKYFILVFIFVFCLNALFICASSDENSMVNKKEGGDIFEILDKYQAALLENQISELQSFLEKGGENNKVATEEEIDKVWLDAYKKTSVSSLPDLMREYAKLKVSLLENNDEKISQNMEALDLKIEKKYGASFFSLNEAAKERVCSDVMYYIVLESKNIALIVDENYARDRAAFHAVINILKKISICGTGLKIKNFSNMPKKVDSQINADMFVASVLANKEKLRLKASQSNADEKEENHENKLIEKAYNMVSLDLLPVDLRECVGSYVVMLNKNTKENRENYNKNNESLKIKWKFSWEELFDSAECRIMDDFARCVLSELSSIGYDNAGERRIYKQNLNKRMIEILHYISKNGTSGDPHSDNKKSPIPSVPFPNLKLEDLNGVASSEKKNADEMPETKNKMKCITWIGGWGIEIDQFNETDQKMPVDFDWITINVESKKFNGMCRIPFSFKGVIPPKKNNKYIIPLNDINLPVGNYKLYASFEKKEKTDKRWPERMQFSIVFEIEMPQFMSPPEDYKKVSQIKESDVFLDFTKPALAVTSENYKGGLAIKGDEYKIPLNVYYHCSPQNGDLLVRMRTESAQEDKPFVGEIFCPPSVDSEEKTRPLYGRRTHTALARLKIKITTGKDTKTIYHPLPVYFFLPAGEKCEFTVLLKNVEWDEKKSRLEIEHQSIPEGSFVNCFPLPFSQMIFHKDTNK